MTQASYIYWTDSHYTIHLLYNCGFSGALKRNGCRYLHTIMKLSRSACSHPPVSSVTQATVLNHMRNRCAALCFDAQWSAIVFLNLGALKFNVPMGKNVMNRCERHSQFCNIKARLYNFVWVHLQQADLRERYPCKSNYGCDRPRQSDPDILVPTPLDKCFHQNESKLRWKEYKRIEASR